MMEPTVTFERTFGPPHLSMSCVSKDYDGPEAPIGLGANEDEALASLAEQLEYADLDRLIEWELFRRVSVGRSCRVSILECERRNRWEQQLPATQP